MDISDPMKNIDIYVLLRFCFGYLVLYLLPIYLEGYRYQNQQKVNKAHEWHHMAPLISIMMAPEFLCVLWSTSKLVKYIQDYENGSTRVLV